MPAKKTNGILIIKMLGLGKPKNLMYYFLTGLTFYLVAYDVLFTVPALGPFPQTVVKSAVFVVVHVMTHNLKKMLGGR
jgi:hypothetical protein